MAIPTVYRWDDVGAPQINRNNEAQYQALFQAILIDGYGSKLPPGSGTNKWSIPFSDADSFILKQGGSSSKKACLKFHTFSTSSNSFARMECADDYSDLNSPINKWDGFSTNDTLPLGFSNNNTSNIPWIIVATERVIICQFGYNSVGVNTSQFDTSITSEFVDNHHWYFGDYKSEVDTFVNNQICIHTNTTTTTISAWTDAFVSIAADDSKIRIAAGYNDIYSGELTAYKLYSRPAVEGAVDIGGYNRTLESVPRYPNPLNGGLYLEYMRLSSLHSIIGRLYGVLIPLQSRPFPVSMIGLTFAGQNDFSGQDIMIMPTYSGEYMIQLGDWGVE